MANRKPGNPKSGWATAHLQYRAVVCRNRIRDGCPKTLRVGLVGHASRVPSGYGVHPLNVPRWNFYVPTTQRDADPVPIDQLSAEIGGEGEHRQCGNDSRESQQAEDPDLDPAVVAAEPGDDQAQ